MIGINSRENQLIKATEEEIIKIIDSRISELKPYVFCKCGKLLVEGYTGIDCPILRKHFPTKELIKKHLPNKVGGAEELGAYKELKKLRILIGDK